MPSSSSKKVGGASMSVNGANPVENLQALLRHLLSERDAIGAKIAALESAIGAFGAAPATVRRGPGRPPGRPATSAPTARVKATPGRRAEGQALKDFIVRVLQKGGGVMSVKDITNGVLDEGYPTRNQTLAKSVGIALTQLPNVSKRGRGKFALK